MSADKPTTIAVAALLSCIGVAALLAAPIMTATLTASLGLPAAAAGKIVAVEALGTALAPLAATFWMGRVRWRAAAIFAILVVVAGNV
jgi:predicted MFS family arabinose efflux permease